MNDGIKNPRPMRDIRMAPRPAARPAPAGYSGEFDTGLSHDELKWAQVTRAMARQQLEDAARAEQDLENRETLAPVAPARPPLPVTPRTAAPQPFAPRAPESRPRFTPAPETPMPEAPVQAPKPGYTAPSFRAAPPPAYKAEQSHPALVRSTSSFIDAAKTEKRKFETKGYEPKKPELVKEEPRSLFEPSEPVRVEPNPELQHLADPLPKPAFTPVSAKPVADLPPSVRNATDPKITEARAKLHESFGMVVLALAATPRYRHIGLGELVPMVFEPMMRDRVAIALSGADEESAKTGHPAAVALWATVSEEVDAKIKEQVAAGIFPLRLKPEDWNSGDITWLFDIVAPSPQMRATVLTSFKQLMKSTELRLHPIVTKLVDGETLKKMGIEQVPAPAAKMNA